MDEKYIQEEIWKNCKKINKYANSKIGIKRSKWFVKYIEDIQFSSVFEVGCFTGRNLKYISLAFPDVKIGGLDINKEGIEFARNLLPKATLYNQSIYDMPNDKWDVVFTMGILIHIPPDGIQDVIEKCVDKANRYIIHIDRQGQNDVLMGRKEFNPVKTHDKFHWAPDIRSIYNRIGYSAVVKEMPKELSRGGATHIITIDKSAMR